MIINPEKAALDWVQATKESRVRPDSIDAILAWDSTNDLAIGIRELDRENSTKAIPWFDAVESECGTLDWFERLSFPRRGATAD